MPVFKLAERNSKLLVYFIKQSDKTSCPIEMKRIHPIHLSEVENHRTLEKTHNNSLVNAPVMTQSLIYNNIYTMWDLFHKHLESIHGKHGVPI